MSKSRKDNKGRVLNRGEIQRKRDLMYVYSYTDDITGKRKYIYSRDLKELRRREQELVRDQLDGLEGLSSKLCNFLFQPFLQLSSIECAA